MNFETVSFPKIIAKSGSGVFGLLLFFSVFSASGAEFSSLINTKMDTRSLQLVEALGLLQDVNAIFPRLRTEFPQLRIMIVDEKIEREDLRGEEILWRDERISTEDTRPYREYLKTVIQSVGFFIAPGLPMEQIPERPLDSFPLMVLKRRSASHAILHEVLHFVQSLTAHEKILPLPKDVLWSGTLTRIYEAMGEEIFVDAFLLQRRKTFQWSREAICFRVNYMRQNMRVLGFRLGELPSGEGDALGQQHRKALYDAYYKVYTLSREIDPCFF